MDYLLKGGTVISSNDAKQQDVLIQGEKIIQVAEHIDESQFSGYMIVDVKGKLLFPGFIDAHTHFDLHVCNTVTADDFATGSVAAIRGGTTTIIDFATQYHGESLLTAYENWRKKAEHKTSCDYGFHMAISDWNASVKDEINQMILRGVTSFKLYMTYDDMKVDDGTIYDILKTLKKVGGIAGVHCENSDLIHSITSELLENGEYGVSNHPKARPAIAEAEAIHRLLCIANLAQAPVIIVHLSTKEGLHEVEAARQMGQKVYVETCPQYLLLDESYYQQKEIESLKYVMAPPLRTKKDQQAIGKALLEDKIQTISTDHCSFRLSQKKVGQSEFTKIPGGIPGVETRSVLMYTYGIEYGNIWNNILCKVLSENPAKLYGLYPRKGCIRAGSDADLVVYDPQGTYTITATKLSQNTDYTPYEGRKVQGKIDKVFLRGQMVVNGDNIIENTGSYIPREGYCL